MQSTRIIAMDSTAVTEVPPPFTIRENLLKMSAAMATLLDNFLDELHHWQLDEGVNIQLARNDLQETPIPGVYRTIPKSTIHPVADISIHLVVTANLLAAEPSATYIRWLGERALLTGGARGFSRLVLAAIFFMQDTPDGVELVFVCPQAYQPTTTTFGGAGMDTAGEFVVRRGPR